jgi:hypothetical protein
VPQLSVSEKSPLFSPPTESDSSFSSPAPALVSCTVCAGADVLTLRSPKLRLVLDSAGASD